MIQVCIMANVTKCPFCDFPLSEHIGGKECIDELEICGRNMEVVNCYASTCDGCAELTMHKMMTMNSDTQLRYCDDCIDEYIMNKGEKFKKWKAIDDIEPKEKMEKAVK